MVLERTPKQYKHLIRIMLTQLVEYENITTTKAKARHLKPHAEKLLKFARRAEAGQNSPRNLLKGRVHTRKAYDKLLLNIMPRIKNITSGFINVTNLLHRRRGDNAPMVSISIKGNEKSEYQKARKMQAIEKDLVPNMKMVEAKILLEEKEFYERKMKEQPEKQEFFKAKIARIQYEQWVLGKTKNEPPRYTLLV